MSIIRVKKDAKYFTASNEPFNDKRLSWETRGLMGFLLSKPNNWQIRMDALEKAGPAGNHKLRRMLAEARRCGYMNRIRLTLEKGKFDWITEVYESPSLNPKPSSGFSTSGLSTSGKLPDIVSTDSEKTNEPLYIEGDEPKIPPVTEPTEDEVKQMEYDLVAQQFSKNTTLPYFAEFYRLTGLLPSGKKAIGEWKVACGALWSSKLAIEDMETALNALLETNFSVKNPGSLQTTMQTIKMRRDKNVTPKQTPQHAPQQKKSNFEKTVEGLEKFLANHPEEAFNG